MERGAIERPLHVLINCRPDRVERNGQMGALIGRLDPARVILIGEPTRSAADIVPPEYRDRIVDLGGRRDPAELLRGILSSPGSDPGEAISLAAIGNIHGQGEALLAQLDRLDRVAPVAAHGSRS